MSKGFKISLLVIFSIVVAWMIPNFFIARSPWWQKSLLEPEIRIMLNPIEKLLVLKIVDNYDNNMDKGYPIGASLYTWFGIKYAVVTTVGCDPGYGCSANTPDNGFVIDRFWTQKDNIKY